MISLVIHIMKSITMNLKETMHIVGTLSLIVKF